MLGFRHHGPLIASLLTACGRESTEAELGGSTTQSCDPTEFECPAGTFCQTGDACGTGRCVEQPPDCNGACDGVCGCNGEYYCNACVAHHSGVDVGALPVCNPPPAGYGASSYGLENQKLILTKEDDGRNRCIRITLEKGDEEGLPFELGVMAPWRLREIIATDNALDCSGSSGGCDVPGVLQGEVAHAASAAGSLDIAEQQGTVPPDVAVDLVLSFDQPWMEAEERFALDNLDVNGPCL